jgi:hypothetical protein
MFGVIAVGVKISPVSCTGTMRGFHAGFLTGIYQQLSRQAPRLFIIAAILRRSKLRWGQD